MNLLLLSGNSFRNKAWIHDVAHSFSEHFDSTYVHNYAHWETGEEFINFDAELAAIASKATDFEPYAIFAKSVGSLVTLRGIAEGKLRPRAVLITGLPLKVVHENGLPIAQWLQKIEVPVILSQNHRDPLGTFQEVAGLLSEVGNAHLSAVSLPGETHEYADLDKLNELSSMLYTE